MEASTEKASAAIKNITGKLGSEGAMPIVVGLVVAIAVSFGVAYFLYYIIHNNILNKRPYLFKETVTPKLGNQVTKIYAGDMPGISNGRRMSFSFWMYINDINKYKGLPRHVLHLGESTLTDGSPVVFLGANDNKLYVAMNKMGGVTFPPWATSTSQKLQFMASKYGMVFDYIPLQRWVHVSVVINESVNGGSITGYLDGELVKTMTTGASVNLQGTVATTDFQNLLLDKRGSLFIGGAMNDPMGQGFSGLVSKVQFYNYDLNVRDVYNDYLSGPISGGLLGKLGYSVRSPIYKTGTQ